MLKKNSGVTLVSLVAIVVILMILAGVSLTSGYSLVQETRVMRIISNMTLVKSKAEIIYEGYQFSGDESELVGTQIGDLDVDISDDEKAIIIDRAKEDIESVEENFENWHWYSWDRETLKANGLDYNMLDENEYFYVNYQYGEIVYSNGTSLDDSNYYFSMSGLSEAFENN